MESTARHQNLLLHGQEEPLNRLLPLSAGPLSLFYQEGFLRYLRLGEHEVLRLINHAVRDHNWGTMPFTIVDEKIKQWDAAFEISYRALIKQNGIDFEWNVLISGSEDGNVVFDLRGATASNFLRNRIGFTVLHPVKECRACAVDISHSDGSSSRQHFPDLISPHQPFSDIKAMQWEIDDGCQAHLQFEGEIFETEDQRNWIDDSYKTYCTPLSLPFPVGMEAGQEVHQRITLSFPNGFGRLLSTEKKQEIVQLALSKEPYSLPAIGVSRSTLSDNLTSEEITNLQGLQLDHYHASLRLEDGAWPEHWKKILQESADLDLPIVLALFIDRDQQPVQRFLEIGGETKARLKAIFLFESDHHATQSSTVEQYVPKLKAAFPDASIGAGTDAFFTELNRDRPKVELLDLITYSINPQVHATDHRSLVETLNAISYTVETARSFAENRSIHVGPISFKMRWNPNATGEQAVDPNTLPPQVDMRQMSLFGAAWTLGCLRSLILSKVEAVTFFETTGWCGLLQASQPAHLQNFPQEAGVPFPLYWILRQILHHKDAEFYPLTSSRPLHVSGLAFKDDKGNLQALLCNFTGDRQRVDLPKRFVGATAWVLEVQIALEKPLTSPWKPLESPWNSQTSRLEPSAIVRLEGGES